MALLGPLPSTASIACNQENGEALRLFLACRILGSIHVYNFGNVRHQQCGYAGPNFQQVMKITCSLTYDLLKSYVLCQDGVCAPQAYMGVRICFFMTRDLPGVMVIIHFASRGVKQRQLRYGYLHK